MRDEVVTREPQRVTWHLNADVPFAKKGRTYRAGALTVLTRPPKGTTFTNGPLQLTAPGRPGSIVEGAVEVRGHQLAMTAPAAERFRFEMILRVD